MQLAGQSRRHEARQPVIDTLAGQWLVSADSSHPSIFVMVIENRTFHRISTAALLLVFAFVIAMTTSSLGRLNDMQQEALRLWVMIMIAGTVLPTISSALSHMIKHKRYGWLWSILILNIFAFYAYGFWVQSTDKGIPDPG